jgi:hypothetical protein
MAQEAPCKSRVRVFRSSVITTRIGFILQGINVQPECHMVEFEMIENLLGMMMDGANYCVDGCIAGVRLKLKRAKIGLLPKHMAEKITSSPPTMSSN